MDVEAKKKALRKLTYGLYVLSARAGEEVAVATVSWLSQASFTPPLVMVGLRADSHVHSIVERSRSFAVGIVGASQRDLAAAFFKPSKVTDNTINGYAFEAGPSTGAPLLTDLPAWFEARVVELYEVGDHSVAVAEVISAGVRDAEAKPVVLADTDWSYGG